MTSLSGEFQTDLGVDDAIVACTEAIDGLGWRIDTVDAQRVIAFTDSGDNPPRIEVNLNQSGDGSEFQIVGSDNERNPLEQDELIAVLDKARDAINRSMEDAERPRASSSSSSTASGATTQTQVQQTGGAGIGGATGTGGDPGAPAGWYPDVYDDSRQRYWDGKEWTDDFRPADGGADAGTDDGEAKEEPKQKKSRKEAREEKRRQSRERAEQRRQERLDKRKEQPQQSGTGSGAAAGGAASGDAGASGAIAGAAAGGAAAGGAAAGATRSRAQDTPQSSSEQASPDRGDSDRPTASGIASIASSKDFRSLHLIATLYQYLGYVVIVLGAIGVIAAAVAAGGGSAIVTLIFGAIGVAFYALLIFGIAAAIRLALAVEQNTRDTAELLRRERG